MQASTPNQVQFAQQIAQGIRKAASYEYELAQAMALSVMDLDALQNEAQQMAHLSAVLGDDPVLDADDALAELLLHWFKRDFFRWVNQPPCDYCGSEATRLVQMAGPTDEEAAHESGRVEVYRCAMCGNNTRFPRYNDPVKLLETRRGRCGEWANCFTLICRAAGLDARVVNDWSDHVWTEYYSVTMNRWIHLDPCEAAFDKPLLYSVGWGKELSYCIATGKDGVADVTKRYTRQYNQVLQRRGLVDEEWLASYIAAVNGQVRAEFPFSERQALEARDKAEAAEMDRACNRTVGDLNLPGRQSGSADWVSSRGEGGAAPKVNKPMTFTRYRWAKGEGESKRPGRLVGGVCRASDENAPSETVERAFDGDKNTKWLDFGGKELNSAFIEYRLLPETEPVLLDCYSLTSANDEPCRDPCNFALEAWNEEKEEWQLLDERKNLKFLSRGECLTFKITTEAPAAHRFRLRVISVRDPEAANSVQLSCLDLYQKI